MGDKASSPLAVLIVHDCGVLCFVAVIVLNFVAKLLYCPLLSKLCGD